MVGSISFSCSINRPVLLLSERQISDIIVSVFLLEREIDKYDDLRHS